MATRRHPPTATTATKESLDLNPLHGEEEDVVADAGAGPVEGKDINVGLGVIEGAEKLRLGLMMAGGLLMLHSLYATAFFVGAGTIHGTTGWLGLTASLLGYSLLEGMELMHRPDLLRERIDAFTHPTTKPWDRVVVLLLIILPTLLYFIAGTDQPIHPHQNHLAVTMQVMGLLMCAMGWAIALWAKLSNPFFSSHVRIQEDRGHHVITSGPYQYVRHPAYSGFLLHILAQPGLLRAPSSMFPVVLICGLLALRTLFEDATLRAELHGYEDYARRVTWRLAPGIW